MPFRRLIAPLLVLAAALACGGGGTSRSGPATGTLTVRFGSDSFPGYGQVIVSLEKLEGSFDGSTWTALGDVKASFDLMSLQNGHSAVILPATSALAGTYSQFRLTWATKNYANPINLAAYVVPTGALTGQPLLMPVTTVVPGPLTVPAGGSVTAQIMLSGQQAVQLRAGTTPYSFQATGQVFDTAKVASIAGNLADGTTPLGGAEVYAETLDGTGLATIQRRAFADASGNYLLEALPASASTAYYVVAQPGSASLAYGAQASGPLNPTSSTTPLTANLAFSSPTAPGALTLTITPASTASQGTWGELRQTLPTGPVGFQTLIVYSQPAATGLYQDQVNFTGLAPLGYGVAAQRSTSGAAPVMQVGSFLTVTGGATTTASIAF